MGLMTDPVKLAGIESKNYFPIGQFHAWGTTIFSESTNCLLHLDGCYVKMRYVKLARLSLALEGLGPHQALLWRAHGVKTGNFQAPKRSRAGVGEHCEHHACPGP